MVNRNRNLEKRLNNSGHKWAYTGSMAMKIHGNSRRIPFYRPVGNINIAVNARNHSKLVPIIARENGKWNLRGPPNVRNRHTKFTSKNGTMKLNLLSKNLAPSMNNVIIVNGVPVMSIKALFNQKVRIGNNKAFNNINYLMKLNNSLKRPNLKRRRSSNWNSN